MPQNELSAKIMAASAIASYLLKNTHNLFYSPKAFPIVKLILFKDQLDFFHALICDIMHQIFCIYIQTNFSCL